MEKNIMMSCGHEEIAQLADGQNEALIACDICQPCRHTEEREYRAAGKFVKSDLMMVATLLDIMRAEFVRMKPFMPKVRRNS